jgi:hypothetical protein
MAKRARGTSTRPGQRAPLQRRGPATPRLSSPLSPATPPTIGLTPAEEARAAELEAAILATERASSSQASAPTTDHAGVRAFAPRPRTATGSIAARASEEYGYVSRDIRRIALIGGSLVVLLLALWAAVQATGTHLY